MHAMAEALMMIPQHGRWARLYFVGSVLLVTALLLAAGCDHQDSATQPRALQSDEGEPAGGAEQPLEDPGFLILAVATDSLSTPVPDAQIDIHVAGTTNLVERVLTGGDGTAVVALEVGLYDALLHVPQGYEAAPGQANPQTGIAVVTEDSMFVGFRLIPIGPPATDGTIAVTVTDGEDPVPGVRIDVLKAMEEAPVASGETGSDGRASFVLSAGVYTVRLTEPEGWELWPGQINPRPRQRVVPGVTTHLAFKLHEAGAPLPDGELHVFVGADSMPLADVWVSATPKEAIEPITGGWTNAQGVAELALPAGAYAVGIEVPEGYELIPGGQPNPHPGVWVHPGEVNWTGFMLHDPLAPPGGDGVLDVRVRTGDRAPLLDAKIEIYRDGPLEPIAEGRTDDRGRVLFTLGSGLYDVRLLVPAGFELQAGEPNPRSHVPVAATDSTQLWFELRRSR